METGYRQLNGILVGVAMHEQCPVCGGNLTEVYDGGGYANGVPVPPEHYQVCAECDCSEETDEIPF